MREITFDELYDMATIARPMLELKAEGSEHDCVKIYLHWTAGWYNNKFDDYHINIDDEGRLWVSKEDDLSDTKQHTWLRNSGSIGVAMDCCAGATTDDLGEAPPTPEQIESMAKCIAVLCRALDLSIDKTAVLTHGEAADNFDGDESAYGEEDCYGCQHGVERWDLQFLGTAESPAYTDDYNDPTTGGNVLRGKANYYRVLGF